MIRRQILSLLVVICLGHVLLISAQVQSKSGLPVIEALAFGAFSRVQNFTASSADGIRRIWNEYFALHNAARDSETLRRRILELEADLQEQQAIAGRARALEELLALKQTVVAPTLAARVIAGNPSPGSYTVTIDCGAEDGVAEDMAVIASRGVVGRVIAPIGAHAARVQLLIDRLAAVAVTFERSNAGGVVVGGSANPPFRAEYVPVVADIQAGERVLTSGQDGIYPQGFLVGTVEKVTRSGGAERQILIQPAMDFSHIDVVLVVLTPARPKGVAE